MRGKETVERKEKNEREGEFISFQRIWVCHGMRKWSKMKRVMRWKWSIHRMRVSVRSFILSLSLHNSINIPDYFLRIILHFPTFSFNKYYPIVNIINVEYSEISRMKMSGINAIVFMRAICVKNKWSEFNHLTSNLVEHSLASSKQIKIRWSSFYLCDEFEWSWNWIEEVWRRIL